MKKNTLVALIAVVVVAIIAFGGRLMMTDGDHGGTPLIGGPFTLVNGDGKTVTDSDFRGKWMLIYFGYTFCPDVCPTALSTVTGAMDKLPPAQADKITPMFITVDPARDTPEVVKGYAEAFHPRMVGLTGSAEQIDAVKKAYKVYGQRAKATGKGDDDATYTVDHSSILYLIGPDGRFAAHFPHGTTVDQLAASLAKQVK